jgi:hypothetical protein
MQHSAVSACRPVTENDQSIQGLSLRTDLDAGTVSLAFRPGDQRAVMRRRRLRVAGQREDGADPATYLCRRVSVLECDATVTDRPLDRFVLDVAERPVDRSMHS